MIDPTTIMIGGFYHEATSGSLVAIESGIIILYIKFSHQLPERSKTYNPDDINYTTVPWSLGRMLEIPWVDESLARCLTEYLSWQDVTAGEMAFVFGIFKQV